MLAATPEQCNSLLEAALANKNPDTRKQAVAALSLAAIRTPAFTKLEGMLQDKDVEVRLAVVASLAEVKTVRARKALRQALDDEVPEVSFAAAKALWAIHDPAGQQALLGILGGQAKTSSNFISKEKRDALRMLHTPRVLFLYAMRQGVGFAPVPGLGEGITSMQALLTDPGTSGRATAALLLGTDKSPAILDALKEALLDKDWSVRAAAVHSLALRNDPKLKPDLEPMLNDEKEAVRLRAAAAVLRLTAIEQKPRPKRESKTNAQ
ncbi:MAG TPA: HEAT repeat domain-containing protein [Bryobacteraceae bacterium]|nr:HEAT repeat domain-containing protein [Bryobacteraceae bacterium]